MTGSPWNHHPMKNLKVLLLSLPHLFRPWCQDVLNAISGKHEVAVYDDTQPIKDQFRDVSVVIDQGGHVGTQEMMDAAANADLWQIMSIGYEHVDIDHIKSKGIPVANVPGQTSAVSLAQCALMFILTLAHRLNDCRHNFDAGHWLEPCGIELEGKTLGVVGLGESGRRLAILGHALGMIVLGANRTPLNQGTQRSLHLTHTYPLNQLDTLIRKSDVVSLHLSLADDTRNIIDARRFGMMKPTAWLINVARGRLIDEAALCNALIDKKLGGAGLDVFVSEPPDARHPVFSLPNVVVTPHIAGFTDGSSRKRAETIAANVDRVAQGFEPLHLIN